jgi:hypothetical protein
VEPGLVLLSDSWLGLFTPLPMYAALRVMVRAEEAWLEERFGDAPLAQTPPRALSAFPRSNPPVFGSETPSH